MASQFPCSMPLLHTEMKNTSLLKVYFDEMGFLTSVLVPLSFKSNSKKDKYFCS